MQIPVKIGTPLYIVIKELVKEITLLEVDMAEKPAEMPFEATIKTIFFTPQKDMNTDNPWLFSVYSNVEIFGMNESARITDDVWYLSFSSDAIICLDFNQAEHILLLALKHKTQEEAKYK